METKRTFAVKSKNDQVRATCTSGGVFFELASKTIAKGGVVYGCAFDRNLMARHIRCDSLEQVRECMGSKYAQSSMGECLSLLVSDLKNGAPVLFSGTPCQVAGVRAVVPERLTEGLLLVDLVCHGVPSPMLFQQHLGAIERARGKTISGYDHRPKNKGWGEYLEVVHYSDQTMEQGTRLSGVWKEIFYRGTAMRPSCYVCPWMIDNRPGDLTIGDFWGIDEAVPGFKDALGVSLVIVNSDKGHAEFSGLSVEAIETKLEFAIKGNPNLGKPTAKPSQRDSMWQKLWEQGFEETCAAMQFRVPLWKHAYRKLKPLLRAFGWKG